MQVAASPRVPSFPAPKAAMFVSNAAHPRVLPATGQRVTEVRSSFFPTHLSASH